MFRAHWWSAILNFCASTAKFSQQCCTLHPTGRCGSGSTAKQRPRQPGGLGPAVSLPDKQQAIFGSSNDWIRRRENKKGWAWVWPLPTVLPRLLDSSIQVHSQPGRGSFQHPQCPHPDAVTLPQQTLPLRPDVSPSGVHFFFFFDELPVLCIDNSPSILQRTQALLSGWGCQVCCAVNQKRPETPWPALNQPSYWLTISWKPNRQRPVKANCAPKSAKPIQGIGHRRHFIELKESTRAHGHHFPEQTC